MKNYKLKIIFCSLLCSVILAACMKSPKINIEENAIGEEKEENGSEEAEKEEASTPKDDFINESRLIADQTFEVNLNPLGKVIFASYEPDTEKAPLADAVFMLKRDEKLICILEGVSETNIRSNQTFNKVEAVSFPDYNSDGYDDIIIICNYSPASGPDVETGYSEVRIYRGGSEGDFLFEKEMSESAGTALDVKTVKNVLGFLGAKNSGRVNEEDAAWKQAYIEYIQDSSKQRPEGYDLIFLDNDNIPELVEIGNCNADGCRIINYANEGINVTQLSRLNFSYIEKKNLLCNSDGNMDHYYDLVYSILDGEMTLIAEGFYGAENNAKLEFDVQGNVIYKYEWDHVSMEEEEYKKALNAVYDTTEAKSYAYPGIAAKEMTTLLEKSLGKTGQVPEIVTLEKARAIFYETHYKSWTDDKMLQVMKERNQYYIVSSCYNDIVNYWEKIRGVTDITNLMEPLFFTDMKYYSKEDFENVPPIVIHLAKNEIYARHGYIFEDEDLNNYFMGCIRYEPTCKSTDFDDSVFNEFEKENLRYLIELSN